MAYGRETIMRGLRKAGEGIRNFDDAYSQKLYDTIDGISESRFKDRDPNAVENAIYGAVHLGSSPVTYLGDKSAGPGYEDRNMAQRLVEPVAGTAKYVLPAVGITAAGKGLYDLSQMLSDDQQTSGTIAP